MDFGRVELTDDDVRLRDEIRAVLAEFVTDDVLDEIERTGSEWSEELCREVGRRGWILPERPREQGGAGLTPFQCELLQQELWGAPLMALSTTKLILIGVEAHGSPELVADLLPKVARGEVRMALGYTEPDCGSDIAAARTRAVRDGDDWVVNGSKMFTTEAHHCQYAFLLTRTDPDLPKHRGLTMFLVPLDAPGVEIGPIHTIGGERTNVVYYGDVRIPDALRIGPVNDGWKVLMGPLGAEHGVRDRSARTILAPTTVGKTPLDTLEAALCAAAAWAAEPAPDGTRAFDDPVVRDRLARVAIDLAAARTAPDPFGRVYGSDRCIHHCAELLSLVGPRALVAGGETGALDDGLLELAHRFGQGTAIYGGTVEIFKNMIAQHVLGLPRPLPAAR